MNAPISDDAQNFAARIVTTAVRAAHPGVDGDLETHLLVAYALRQYGRYAASADRFGPEHETTRAFLELATSLAAPLGDETDRLAMIALTG